MNPEKNTLAEEQLEIEEQAIGEPMNVLDQEPEQLYKTVTEMTNEEQDELL